MRIGITFDFKDKSSLDAVRNIIKFLKDAKYSVIVESKIANVPKNVSVSEIKHMNAEILVSIGSSFNVLRTFRELGNLKTPVLSVSTTSKSFLSEITTEQFPKAIEKIQAGDYEIEEHSRLEISGESGGFPTALNDIVVVSRKSATIISYSVFVDKKLAFKDVGDGVIISTPTGSTGYSVSAGGPAVFSNAKVLVITPISSLAQNGAVVLNDNSIIQIKSISSSAGADIVIDGRFRSHITGNDITIKNALSPARFIRFKEFDKSILDKLRKRLENTAPLSISAPPSAKFILKVLQYEGALTQKELISITSMPPRTVRSGLSYLIRNKIIEEQRALRDARYSLYYITSS